MQGYEPAMSFDEETARADRDFQRGDEEAAVAFLGKLAGTGPALELGIGTGRIALPLAAQGIPVDGIDISPAMVAQLRTRPGGDQISVTLGDFAEAPLPGRYRPIFVVFNTFFNLLSQEKQVRCFANVAAHLTPDGSFVVEGLMPGHLYQLRNNQYVDVEAVGVDEVRLDVLRFDPTTQLLEESHIALSPDGVRLNPVMQRYASPAELDLMARLAGLRLVERWSSWDRAPLTAASTRHISVYGWPQGEEEPS